MAFTQWRFLEFWLRLVVGTFGAWKTKNTFQEAWYWKQQNPDGILIANVPYNFVDVHFSSKSDLNLILAHIRDYVDRTNVKTTFMYNRPAPILILVDEAHLYYFSRDFKGFDKDTLLILTQCRKRKISIVFITQELAQLDIFIRRLVPYITLYSTLIFGFGLSRLFHVKDPDVTNLEDVVNFEEQDREYLFPDWWQALRNKRLKREYFRDWVFTYYVIWLRDMYAWKDGAHLDIQEQLIQRLEFLPLSPKQLRKYWLDEYANAIEDSHTIQDTIRELKNIDPDEGDIVEFTFKQTPQISLPPINPDATNTLEQGTIITAEEKRETFGRKKIF